MKLEKGMYVRTDDGIFKIYAIAPKEEDYYKLILEKNNGLSIGDSEFVAKASHNIKDLIEVGDIINHKYIVSRSENGNISFYEEMQEYDITENIKTILTHEQFEDNCYKVGD